MTILLSMLVIDFIITVSDGFMKFFIFALFVIKLIFLFSVDGIEKWLALIPVSLIIVIAALWVNYSRVNEMHQQYSASKAEKWLSQSLQELIALALGFSLLIILSVNLEFMPLLFLIDNAVLMIVLLFIYYWGINSGFKNALRRMEAINTVNNHVI